MKEKKIVEKQLMKSTTITRTNIVGLQNYEEEYKEYLKQQYKLKILILVYSRIKNIY